MNNLFSTPNGIVLVVVALFLLPLVVFLWEAWEDRPILKAQKKKSSDKQVELLEVYTEEEIELAQFLAQKERINDAFLSAQSELLKELRRF